MRFDEIASAEDQIALFKLITDKVWQALGDQQRADADAKAAEPLKAKLKLTSPKKPKPSAARPVPKLKIKTVPLSKPTPQSSLSQSIAQQTPNIQSQITKQKQNANFPKEPESAGFDEFDSQKLKIARDKERYS
jgi:hypothetical protein